MPAFSPARNSEEPFVRMFATCMPGLAPLLAKQLSTLDNAKVVWLGNDGRADIVSFTVGPAMASLVAQVARIADDLFLQIGHARRSDGDRAGWLAQRLRLPPASLSYCDSPVAEVFHPCTITQHLTAHSRQW